MRVVEIEAVEADRLYAVSLIRPIRVGRSFIRPGPSVRLAGGVIREVAEDVAEIREVAS